ncbi:MAG: hypothetical protein LC126_10595 [Bryobacterales bacterium]|nr:hypothetical protein [Bryobacterales bacterium]
MKRRHKAVAPGGGFAGLKAAFFLRHKLHGKADITLVSNRGYFLFKAEPDLRSVRGEPGKVPRLDRSTREAQRYRVH